jgi:hypothetical protein
MDLKELLKATTNYSTIKTDDIDPVKYRPAFKVFNDDIAKLMDKLMSMKKFNLLDNTVSLDEIFSILKTVDEKDNGFTNKLYNLDYISPMAYRGKKKKEIIEIGANLKQKLTTLWNNIKVAQEDRNILYFTINHRLIHYKILKHVIDNKKSLETYKTDLNTITQVFKTNLGVDYPLYKSYRALTSALHISVLRRLKSNNITTKKDAEHISPFDELLKIQLKLQKNYEDDSSNHYIKNLQLLYFSSYVLTPPVRGEIRLLKFSFDKAAALKDTDNDYIYLDMNNNDQIAEFILNKHKKSNDSTSYEIGYISNNGKNLFGLELTRLYKKSYNQFNRTYCFENMKTNKPYSADTAKNWLLNLIDGKKTGINSIRSSVASYFHANNSYSHAVKETVAKKMRHSVNIASSNYNRIDETKKQTNADEKPKTINVNVIGSTKQEGNDKSRMKKYYVNNKDKILKQQSDFYKNNQQSVRARKNVAYLNKNQSEPRKENIEKYKLEKRDGVWITLL